MYKVRAFITDEDNNILIVRQNSRYNKLVWTFPGGKSKFKNSLLLKYICKKKVKQKTGLKIKIKELVIKENTLYLFKAEVAYGDMKIDKNNPKNKDVLELQWVNKDDSRLNYKFNRYIVDRIFGNN